MPVSTLAIFTVSKHKYTVSGPIAVANSADWLHLSISARGRHSSMYHKACQHVTAGAWNFYTHPLITGRVWGLHTIHVKKRSRKLKNVKKRKNVVKIKNV